MLISVGQGPHNLKFPKTLQWGWEEVEAGLALKPKEGLAEKAAVSASHSLPHSSQPIDISLAHGQPVDVSSPPSPHNQFIDIPSPPSVKPQIPVRPCQVPASVNPRFQ